MQGVKGSSPFISTTEIDINSPLDSSEGAIYFWFYSNIYSNIFENLFSDPYFQGHRKPLNGILLQAWHDMGVDVHRSTHLRVA